MKHLLNGVAIAAALAIAAPAWAQTAPMTPGAPKAPPAASAPAPAAKAPAAKRHRATRHARGSKAKASRGDQMTEQLNREELARIQGGGAPAGPPPRQLPGPPNAGAGQGGPRSN
jgi:hypothetical protein